MHSLHHHVQQPSPDVDAALLGRPAARGGGLLVGDGADEAQGVRPLEALVRAQVRVHEPQRVEYEHGDAALPLVPARAHAQQPPLQGRALGQEPLRAPLEDAQGPPVPAKVGGACVLVL